MYRTNSEIAKMLSEYQISLMLYLNKGCHIVTNEGSYFRAWLEYERKEVSGLAVRKDSADKLLSLGVIKEDTTIVSRLYYYTLSENGLKVLSILNKSLINKLMLKMKSIEVIK